ncbi:radical SAM family heme chaperone HemW [Mesonia sp. MT50]|uniref:Heme chaperone HemW n=1 Tax=Mesonia profundi TaxID=3070998 RepID=A0ABU1A0X7_9FLAO|nr:radical SAM family heme chaperone HemW [Mesonia profundi]MDQ7917360.1 radical SAM family heme chaperone HemW [Mesonia profundi]
MAGIYIHIPFCKQACHYCDFHFSTGLKRQPEMVDAISQEIILRKEEQSPDIKTIYFGGGTPSLLSKEQILSVLETINAHFEVSLNAEITLEANPDDLSLEKIKELAQTPINRLSIGVQSFFEEDLQLMNRAHNQAEALSSIQNAKKYFDNISIDLIYGIPKMSEARWRENLEITLSLEVPHISSYALTVEPNTALRKMIDKGKVAPVEDALAKAHFDILQRVMSEAGFVNYEFSNFGKPGYFSKNNTAYWMGESYLGIGPSAHSYHQGVRSWNVANNIKYVKAIQNKTLPLEQETLSVNDAYNEYVMTRLRTMWGIDLAEVEKLFGATYVNYLAKELPAFVEKELLEKKGEKYTITQKGKFLSDGIAADLFYIE